MAQSQIHTVAAAVWLLLLQVSCTIGVAVASSNDTITFCTAATQACRAAFSAHGATIDLMALYPCTACLHGGGSGSCGYLTYSGAAVPAAATAMCIGAPTAAQVLNGTALDCNTTHMALVQGYASPATPTAALHLDACPHCTAYTTGVLAGCFRLEAGIEAECSDRSYAVALLVVFLAFGFTVVHAAKHPIMTRHMSKVSRSARDMQASVAKRLRSRRSVAPGGGSEDDDADSYYGFGEDDAEYDQADQELPKTRESVQAVLRWAADKLETKDMESYPVGDEGGEQRSPRRTTGPSRDSLPATYTDSDLRLIGAAPSRRVPVDADSRRAHRVHSNRSARSDRSKGRSRHRRSPRNNKHADAAPPLRAVVVSGGNGDGGDSKGGSVLRGAEAVREASGRGRVGSSSRHKGSTMASATPKNSSRVQWVEPGDVTDDYEATPREPIHAAMSHAELLRDTLQLLAVVCIGLPCPPVLRDSLGLVASAVSLDLAWITDARLIAVLPMVLALVVLVAVGVILYRDRRYLRWYHVASERALDFDGTKYQPARWQDMGQCARVTWSVIVFALSSLFLPVVKAVLEISVCHANAACGFCGAGRAVFGSSGGGAILGLLSWILALVVVPALCWFLATQSRPQTGSSLPAVVQALPPPPAAGAATDAAAAGDAAVTVAAAQVGDGRGSLMSIGSQFSDGSSEPSRPTYSHHRHRGRGPMSPNDPRRDGPCKRCTARSRDRVATCWARCAATRLRAWCGTSCTRCRRRTQCCYQPGQEEVHKRKISVYRFIEKLMKDHSPYRWLYSYIDPHWANGHIVTWLAFKIVVVLVVTLLGEAAPAATHVIVAVIVALTLAYLLHYRPIMEPKARASAVLGCLAILCVTATSASSAIANTAFVPGIVGAALCSMLACTQLWLALPRVWIRQRALHRLDIGPREMYSRRFTSNASLQRQVRRRVWQRFWSELFELRAYAHLGRRLDEIVDTAQAMGRQRFLRATAFLAQNWDVKSYIEDKIEGSNAHYLPKDMARAWPQQHTCFGSLTVQRFPWKATLTYEDPSMQPREVTTSGRFKPGTVVVYNARQDGSPTTKVMPVLESGAGGDVSPTHEGASRPQQHQQQHQQQSGQAPGGEGHGRHMGDVVAVSQRTRKVLRWKRPDTSGYGDGVPSTGVASPREPVPHSGSHRSRRRAPSESAAAAAAQLSISKASPPSPQRSPQQRGESFGFRSYRSRKENNSSNKSEQLHEDDRRQHHAHHHDKHHHHHRSQRSDHRQSTAQASSEVGPGPGAGAGAGAGAGVGGGGVAGGLYAHDRLGLSDDDGDLEAGIAAAPPRQLAHVRGHIHMTRAKVHMLDGSPATGQGRRTRLLQLITDSEESVSKHALDLESLVQQNASSEVKRRARVRDRLLAMHNRRVKLPKTIDIPVTVRVMQDMGGRVYNRRHLKNVRTRWMHLLVHLVRFPAPGSGGPASRRAGRKRGVLWKTEEFHYCVEASRDEVRVRPGYRVVEVVDPDGTVVARARATRAAPLDYGIVGHPVRPARAGHYTIWELPAKPLPDEYPTPETASQFLRVQVGDYRPNPPPPPTIMVVSEIDPHTQNRYDHGVSSLDVKERTVTVKRPVGFDAAKLVVCHEYRHKARVPNNRGTVSVVEQPIGFKPIFCFYEGKGPKTFGEQVDNIVHTAEAGVVGLSPNYSMSSDMIRLFKMNRDITEKHVRGVIQARTQRRKQLRTQRRIATRDLQELFLPLLYAAPALPPRASVDAYFTRYESGFTRRLVSRHAEDLDLLYQRIETQLTTPLSRYWYTVWDELWLRNKNMPEFDVNYDLLDVIERSAICWKPMARTALEELLRSRGLFDPLRPWRLFGPVLYHLYSAMERFLGTDGSSDPVIKARELEAAAAAAAADAAEVASLDSAAAVSTRHGSSGKHRRRDKHSKGGRHRSRRRRRRKEGEEETESDNASDEAAAMAARGGSNGELPSKGRATGDGSGTEAAPEGDGPYLVYEEQGVAGDAEGWGRDSMEEPSDEETEEEEEEAAEPVADQGLELVRTQSDAESQDEEQVVGVKVEAAGGDSDGDSGRRAASPDSLNSRRGASTPEDDVGALAGGGGGGGGGPASAQAAALRSVLPSNAAGHPSLRASATAVAVSFHWPTAPLDESSDEDSMAAKLLRGDTEPEAPSGDMAVSRHHSLRSHGSGRKRGKGSGRRKKRSSRRRIDA